jgi:hypothetical protein
MRFVGLLSLALAAAFTLGCRGGSHRQRGPERTAFAAQRPGACSSGRSIDSAYVVSVAVEALPLPTGAGTLRPISYEAVVSPGGIEEGILVRLVAPGRVGGGGLAFVDSESGWALALRIYE